MLFYLPALTKVKPVVSNVINGTTQWVGKGKDKEKAQLNTTTSRVTLKSVGRSDSGTYKCEADNNFTPSASGDIVLIVNSKLYTLNGFIIWHVI